jgi:hypothetical protein
VELSLQVAVFLFYRRPGALHQRSFKPGTALVDRRHFPASQHAERVRVRPACRAVLCYDQRIALDGSPAETVDAEAKDLAAKQLAKLAARKAAKKAAEAAAPAVVNPKPASAPPPALPPETPKQLRDLVRASLLRRSA